MAMTQNFKQWRWAGAIRRGVSHSEDGLPCQDLASLAELFVDGEAVLVLAVCDGAGSCPLSKHASFFVSQSVQSCARHYFRDGGKVSALGKDILQQWLCKAEAALQKKAAELGCQMEDLYTTVTVAVVCSDATHVIQVGDCACAVLAEGEWSVPIWPMNGRYANLTWFLHDFPHTKWAYALLESRVDALAVFSDGPAELLLQRKEQKPFAPFFDQVIPHLLTAPEAGRSREISAEVVEFLDSPRVCAQTLDDKTLILAARSNAQVSLCN